ncbi:hypothetical protein TrCOL_g12754 [Triparma columacea]|uniref:Translocation protein SEC62 n=1 Tax=Triparma columacea TaxID=722753 RepID=A0A9W7LDZ0_9STRA|nr:hypothetical protein TrCOL_g12754 [Triparma columacea]
MEFYDEPKGLIALCVYLRSKDGPSVREAVLSDKRVLYLKGEKLITSMVEPKKGKWPKNLPKITDRTDAVKIARNLCKAQYLLRAEKVSKGILQMSRNKEFEESGYYAWLFEGDQTYSNLLTGVVIVGFLACVCFPIWPQFLKVWVWYLSVTFLISIFGLCILRLVVFLTVWVCGFEFWILPNLFDESLGVAESFIPLFTFNKAGAGQGIYRAGLVVLLAWTIHWAISQPTEFDGMIKAQKGFLDDLYSGNLLSDMSQQSKDDIDKPRMKSLDDLLQELDAVDVDEDEVAEKILDQLMEEDERAEAEE